MPKHKKNAPTIPTADAEKGTTLSRIYVYHPALEKTFAVPVDAFLDGEVFRLPKTFSIHIHDGTPVWCRHDTLPDVVAFTRGLDNVEAFIYSRAIYYANAWLMAHCLGIGAGKCLEVAEKYQRFRIGLANYLLRNQKPPRDAEEGAVHIYFGDPVKFVIRVLAKRINERQVKISALRRVMVRETFLAKLFLACMARQYKYAPEKEQTRFITYTAYSGKSSWGMLKELMGKEGVDKQMCELLRKDIPRSRELLPIRDMDAYMEALVFLYCLFAKAYISPPVPAFLEIDTTVEIELPEPAAAKQVEKKPRKKATRRRRRYRGMPVASTPYKSPRTPEKKRLSQEQEILWRQIEDNRHIDNDLEEE